MSDYVGISAKQLVADRTATRAWEALARVGLRRGSVARRLGRSRLTLPQIELLDEMRRDNARASAPFRATEHWTRLNARFDDWFHAYGLNDVETTPINRFLSSPSPTDPKLLRYACWMLYRDLQRRDEMGVLSRIRPTIHEASGRAFQFPGHPGALSWDLLISLDLLLSIAEIDDSVLAGDPVLVDLGGGWGRLGYVLKLINPHATYVVCDLPETLLVSSQYLPEVLPEETYADYFETRKIETFTRDLLKRGRGTWFCGAQDLERFSDSSIDIFVSIASFQEMPLEQVDAYFDLIDAKVAGVFFTQQVRSARTHNLELGEIEGLSDYPFRARWSQLFTRSPAWSDLYFETARAIGRRADL
jgi:putative sugar O-methyltransferase